MIQICDDQLIFLLLLLVSVVSCETKEILTFTAHERGTVEIKCPYESRYKEYEKYLCRGECPILNKDKVIESGSSAGDERFSLTDDRTAHIFTVTITDLRTEDRGQYWCGIKTGLLKLDDSKEVHLDIKHVSRVSAVTGQHLNISCHYKSELKNDVKFICKGSDPSVCEKSAIRASSETNSNSRFSLSDNESAGVFTVIITDLTEEDSGRYWCGAAQRGQEHKNKWISVIDLNVSAGLTPFILPSVMGILMAFGFLVCIYLSCRQNKEGVRLRGVIHVLADNLSAKEATHTVCHYEVIICTDSSGLGLPVFDEHDTCSTVIFQTTDHPDRTSDGQETCS
ncbi:polymeric immunoglobulin receptor isoform X11 [Carassius gibelio]|uniref:polymeric immunoglobulin receptor isoform X11 n=1 Tax=Carassius gibelio TaxID=101364 RepID=UPI002278552F|nr:polymeric immunoglobulin receptor isoform X11 [Carassius gibelio]